MTARHTVVIADDEMLARRRLRQLVGATDGFDVIGEVGDGTSALETVRTQLPHVLFLDVQMPGLDPFTLLDTLGEQPPVVVFVTAHPEYAPRAFDVEAVDYLVKPVSRDRFARTVDRLR